MGSYAAGHNASRPQTDKRTTMKNQIRSAALGRPAMKLLGGGLCVRLANYAFNFSTLLVLV